MAVVAIMATMNVVAQNVRHDIGSFTLQPMAGVSVGSMSGTISYYTLDYTSSQKVERKDEMRLGFVGGLIISTTGCRLRQEWHTPCRAGA